MLFPTDPQSYKMLHDMDIYSPKGTQVVYGGFNGYAGDLLYASLYLKVGEIYTVESIDIGSSCSYVTLEEFPNKKFNSVMFIHPLV